MSKWKEEYSGPEGFVKSKDDGDTFHLIIGDSSKGGGRHDHYIYDKRSGSSKIIHRGECDECSDKAGGK
jgi:hypothetical protein